MMKKLLIAVFGALLATSAFAADDCATRAAEKKLAGAAKASFMKKCEKDSASASCEATAKEKKLAGAARNSFVKKCVSDAQAAPVPAEQK